MIATMNSDEILQKVSEYLAESALLFDILA